MVIFRNSNTELFTIKKNYNEKTYILKDILTYRKISIRMFALFKVIRMLKYDLISKLKCKFIRAQLRTGF